LNFIAIIFQIRSLKVNAALVGKEKQDEVIFLTSVTTKAFFPHRTIYVLTDDAMEGLAGSGAALVFPHVMVRCSVQR
jgi:hypothetical protein